MKRHLPIVEYAHRPRGSQVTASDQDDIFQPGDVGDIDGRKLYPAVAVLAYVRLKGFGANDILTHGGKGEG